MCIFSRHVECVNKTQIFGRNMGGGRQVIVYSMTIESLEEAAMILPIPVAGGTGEKAVRFINLKEYPQFFGDMFRGFRLAGRSMGRTQSLKSMARLEVVEVGNFVASYVPSVSDFKRLDPQFRLPQNVWNKLPQYNKFGFAVFQLKSGNHTIHPMAFDFPKSNPGTLFFPTVHIHDGKVHETADFDHRLFCQKIPGDAYSLKDWLESPGLAMSFMKLDKSQGMIIPGMHCYMLGMHGMRKNEDVVIQ